MFKKIIAAGAMLALFACSSNNENNSVSSSSEQGNGAIGSSSSQDDSGNSSSSGANVPSIVPVNIALNGEQQSILLQTFYYTYALKAGSPEDYTQFWNVADAENCKVETQETRPPASCQLDMANAILQHNLTNQYFPLHYDRVLTRIDALIRAVTLKQWNLTGPGDEAALGLNVYTDEANVQNIGERGLESLNNIVSFEYTYAASGAHEFRIGSKTEADFWYYEVPATKSEITLTAYPPESEYTTITIPVNELKGMGSYAASGAKEETPFDISKAAKFLWAVKHSTSQANNTGSLVLYNFRANVEQ